MPAHCIDAHFAKGEPCSSTLKTPPKLDVVWIWANGSDPLFQYAISDAEDSQGVAKTKVSLKKGAKLYRSVLPLWILRRVANLMPLTETTMNLDIHSALCSSISAPMRASFIF